MNTKSIAGAARVICEAMGRPSAVPATIAVALDAGGWLNLAETAAELVRLRLLQNAMPAELSEAQLEALIDAGNRALNDYYHERACSCSEWPKSCASSVWNFSGAWDTDAFAIGAAAVVGVWESMRAPAEADEIARLRSDRVEDRAQFEEYRTLVATLRARVAELEALTPAAIQTCLKCGAGYYLAHGCAICQFKGILASHQKQAAGLTAAELKQTAPGAYQCQCGHWDNVHGPFCFVEVCECGSFTHPGPEHHDYRVGRDLPEMPNV